MAKPTMDNKKASSSTATEVRSPTKTSTSTDAYTAGNVTVTGGAGRGANTHVSIYTMPPKSVKKTAAKANKKLGKPTPR